jgi:four helix bundle protein
MACTALVMLSKFRAFALAKDLYQRCKKLNLPEPLRDQVLRATSSIALNLAEGSGRRTSADRKRFFTMALGSLRECEAVLLLECVGDPTLHALMDELGAIVFTLAKKPGGKRSSDSDPT